MCLFIHVKRLERIVKLSAAFMYAHESLCCLIHLHCSYEVLRTLNLLSLPFLNNFAWILVILASFMIWDGDGRGHQSESRQRHLRHASLPAPSSVGHISSLTTHSLSVNGVQPEPPSCEYSFHLLSGTILPILFSFPKGRRIWRCSVLEIAIFLKGMSAAC